MISWRALNQRKGIKHRAKHTGKKHGTNRPQRKTLTRLGDRLAKRRRREVRNAAKREAAGLA